MSVWYMYRHLFQKHSSLTDKVMGGLKNFHTYFNSSYSRNLECHSFTSLTSKRCQWPCKEVEKKNLNERQLCIYKLLLIYYMNSNEAHPSKGSHMTPLYLTPKISRPFWWILGWKHVETRVVIPGVRRPFGGHTGRAGRRPCPLRLIWTGWGTIDKEIIVANLLYYSNFSYYCPPTWSRGGWQSEVAVYRSASTPIWPFKFTMGGQSTPFWPLSGGREGLSGRQAVRPTNNPGWNMYLLTCGPMIKMKW
jgi:hypothetical protein